LKKEQKATAPLPSKKSKFTIGIFIVAILLLLAAVYFTGKGAMVTKNSFTEVKGKLAYSNVTVTIAHNKHQVSKLMFSLLNNEQVFVKTYDTKTITDNPLAAQYSSTLKLAKTVSVLVENSEVKSKFPEVYQLKTDTTVLADYTTDLKYKYFKKAIALAIAGIVGLVFVLRKRKN